MEERLQCSWEGWFKAFFNLVVLFPDRLRYSSSQKKKKSPKTILTSSDRTLNSQYTAWEPRSSVSHLTAIFNFAEIICCSLQLSSKIVRRNASFTNLLLGQVLRRQFWVQVRLFLCKRQSRRVDCFLLLVYTTTNTASLLLAHYRYYDW